jgi:hypothetical protein
MARGRSIIEDLPGGLRAKVDEALALGRSLRAVAEIAGCSHTVIQDYKRNIWEPARKLAAKLLDEKPTTADIARQVDRNLAEAEATRAVIAADPILSRMEQRRRERAEVLQEARAKGDVRGWAAVDRNDISATELEARLTGRLDAQPTGANCAVIVLPVAGLPGGMPALPAAPRQLGPGDVEFLPPAPAATT